MDRRGCQSDADRTRRTTSALALTSLAGCAERELILPGQRLRHPHAAGRQPARGRGRRRRDAAEGIDAGPVRRTPSRPVSLPAALSLAAWPQRGANPAHRLPHLALRAQPAAGLVGQYRPRQRPQAPDHRRSGVGWRADLYTLDSRARVTADFHRRRRGLDRRRDAAGRAADEGSGGGLALAGGRLFVSSGLRHAHRARRRVGKILWTQALGAVGNAAPAVSGDLVYVIGRDNRAWAVRTADGKVGWSVSGTPAPSGYVGGGGAAVDDRIAVLPFCQRRDPGGPAAVGAAQLGHARFPASAAARSMPRSATSPAIRCWSATRLYAGNASGRLVAAGRRQRRAAVDRRPRARWRR